MTATPAPGGNVAFAPEGNPIWNDRGPNVAQGVASSTEKLYQWLDPRDEFVRLPRVSGGA